MRNFCRLICALCVGAMVGTVAAETEKELRKPAVVATMAAEELAGFETYTPQMQAIVREALELTKMNLRYQFGASEPTAGGMDCSGAIYYLLREEGIKTVPRQSDEICEWVMKQSVLYRTENVGALDETPFKALKPGDLLFWTGTYETSTPRELPISHVMLYLGKRKKDGKAVVFGASDGRTYEGQRRNGVSVFDFALPMRASKTEFFGYGAIPQK